MGPHAPVAIGFSGEKLACEEPTRRQYAILATRSRPRVGEIDIIAGWVQKLSKKGWICKTGEGELALVSMPGAAPEKFFFTIRDDAIAEQVTRAMGKRVSLHYEEKVGLPTTCFGETRHLVSRVALADEISLSPGVTVQAAPPPASAPVGAAASASR